MYKKTSILLVTLAVGLMAQTASAANWFVQPTTGQPWAGVGISLETLIDQGANWAFDDGTVCYRGHATATWITPVPLTATGKWYNADQWKTTTTSNGRTSKVSSRNVSFRPDGRVYNISASSESQRFGGVHVPSNGTIFTQTAFTGFSGTRQCLHTVRLNH